MHRALVAQRRHWFYRSIWTLQLSSYKKTHEHDSTFYASSLTFFFHQIDLKAVSVDLLLVLYYIRFSTTGWTYYSSPILFAILLNKYLSIRIPLLDYIIWENLNKQNCVFAAWLLQHLFCSLPAAHDNLQDNRTFVC